MSEYKRLTYRERNGRIAYKGDDTSYRPYVLDSELAQEMGLRLADLEDKIENKTLIELPCNQDDNVWFICNGQDINNAFVSNMPLYMLKISELQMIGTIFFTTKEAAEARLAELKGENK